MDENLRWAAWVERLHFQDMNKQSLLRSTLLLAASLLLAHLSPAATYYISPSGNDSHSGTSPGQAWRTLARVAQVQYALQPGDQVLFERGGVFRGELPVGSSGTEGAPLVFGAYGTGAAPVIAGSDAVTGWTQHQGNIWRAPVSSAVSHLFVDGQLMTLARYPNTGWLRMNSGTPTSLHDADLGQPAGYWTGAQAVIRASHWSYDVAEITGYSDHTLHFPSIGESPGNYTWGYFLQGKLSELDMPGEWHYDAAAGMLYLHAPGNADPNTLQVEASVRANGAVIAWQRQYVRIQDLAFRHQHGACVRNDGGNRITVANCSFTQAYHGVRSYGSLNTYTGCTFTELYATGAHLIDNGTEFSDNQMHDIANRPGLGESLWGYFGVRAAGSDIVLRGNVLDNIGYIGLAVDNNALVEHNVVENCLMTLNDGGGITFDFADGIIVRNNIVRNMVGNMESAAPEHPNSVLTSHGIYFGNTSIRNTLVQGNTVTGCAGSGIHVDHTMVSSGNAIKDNVLFGNGVQLSISDFSNYNGPGAQPPYHKPSFDGVYSGNVLYALSKDQLCMRQYSCYNATPVEFGSFSNNYYYNPYNELSILMVNTFAYGETYYTLERWQADRGQDAGSSRSPLRLPGHATVAELGGNLVQNGGFNAHVNGWSGWPANAQVSHVTGQLDGGALRAYLPNNSQYNSFTLNSPDHFPVQDQAWYRLRFSLKSDAHGDLVVGLKGQSQNDQPYRIAEQLVPFSSERRDLELYFQSDRMDQGRIQFINQWTEPMYYLDNVEVTPVTVEPVDPYEHGKIFINAQSSAQAFDIPDGCWTNLDGVLLHQSVQVPAFSSAVIVIGPDDLCSLTTSVEEPEPAQEPVVYPNPAPAGAVLNLHQPSGQQGDYVISDAYGRTVLTGRIPAGGQAITIDQGLASGTYLLTITGQEQRASTRLVVF